MLDKFSKYDIKRPIYIQPHGGARTGSGRKHGWDKSSYPLQKIMLPPKLVAAIISARKTGVDEETMVTVIKNLKGQ